MKGEYRRIQQDRGAEPGAETFFLVEIESRDLPVLEIPVFLEPERFVEVGLHGEHVQHDQQQHRGRQRQQRAFRLENGKFRVSQSCVLIRLF